MRHVIALLLVGGIVMRSEAKEMKFLEKYNGQTVDQLIAMESDYRVDSLVLAFEQAMEQKKAKQKLSPAEIDILAVEAMEREVNNGGYHQFFLNSSREYAAVLPSSLERIGCPVAAKIASDALACLKISGEVTAAKIDAALQRLGGTAVEDLGKMDERYFQNEEPIAGRLFARIKAQKGQIVLR